MSDDEVVWQVSKRELERLAAKDREGQSRRKRMLSWLLAYIAAMLFGGLLFPCILLLLFILHPVGGLDVSTGVFFSGAAGIGCMIAAAPVALIHLSLSLMRWIRGPRRSLSPLRTLNTGVDLNDAE